MITRAVGWGAGRLVRKVLAVCTLFAWPRLDLGVIRRGNELNTNNSSSGKDKTS